MVAMSDNVAKTMTADFTAFYIDDVVGRGVNADYYRRWCWQYVDKFKSGAAVFWPWYQEQMVLSDIDALAWPIPYPHEIYPALMTGAYPEFYDWNEKVIA